MFYLLALLFVYSVPLRTRPPPSSTPTFNRIPVIATGSIIIPGVLISGVIASFFFLNDHKTHGEKIQNDDEEIKLNILEDEEKCLEVEEPGNKCVKKKASEPFLVKVTKTKIKENEEYITISTKRTKVADREAIMDKNNKTWSKIDEFQYEEDYYSYEEEYYEKNDGSDVAFLL